MRLVAACVLLLLLVAGGTARRSKKKAQKAFRDPNEAIAAATAAQEAGDLEGAYRILDEAIESSPKVFSPYFAKGQMMCKADDYRACKELYTKGIELSPPAHRGMFTQNIALELGQAAYRAGQASGSKKPKKGAAAAKAAPGLRSPYKTALTELETALSLSKETPAWVRALYTKGQVHEAVAKVDQGGWATSESAKLSIAAWEEVLQRLAASQKLAEELKNVHPDCHTNLGVSFERLDRLAEAEVQFRAALALQPNHQVALGHLRDVVDWQYPGEPERWHAVSQQGIDQGIWERIDQTPAMHYYTGLPTTPWPDVSSYPAVAATVAAMEAATEQIRMEMHSIMNVEGKGGLRFGAMEALATTDGRGQERGGWHAMIVDCDRKRDHTPITCGVIDQVTDPGVGGVEIITSQFLRLQPGVKLRPHCGEGNFRWVMHLGLDVPKGVAITVGGETVSWEEGKVITFDDSYRHSVAHNGDSDRVVLAMQIMNPEYLRWRDAGKQQQDRRIDL